MNQIRLRYNAIHPSVRHTAFISAAIFILLVPLLICAGLRVGWVEALEILIGDRGPSAAGELALTIPLAILGYALLPVILGLIVTTVLQRAFERTVLTRAEATQAVDRLIRKTTN